MQENRKSRRVNLIDRLEVDDAHSNKLLGIMVDISAGGFKMITSNQMEQGKEYLLNIVLPGKNSDRKNVVVTADIRWCGKDINPGLFAAGCYLVQIEAKDRLDLAALMFNKANSKDDAISEVQPEFPSPNGKV
jgi:hypothetical protein